MNKVKITLHGVLAEQVGKSQWNLMARNVREAISGVQTNCKNLYSSLIKNDKKKIKYRVLINGDDFFIEEGKSPNTREGLRSSQLCLEKISNLKSIDIVPVVEGASDWFDWLTVVIGFALIFVGGAGILAGYGWGSLYGMAVIAGVGLVAAGVANLLTDDPEFDDFREIEGGGRAPYTFSGPQNVVREGGPVFIGYGRLLVGSQVIQASTDHFDEDAGVPQNTDPNGGEAIIWGRPDYGLKYNVTNISADVHGRVEAMETEITPDP